jgi:hypothetical protein
VGLIDECRNERRGVGEPTLLSDNLALLKLATTQWKTKGLKGTGRFSQSFAVSSEFEIITPLRLLPGVPLG